MWLVLILEKGNKNDWSVENDVIGIRRKVIKKILCKFCGVN